MLLALAVASSVGFDAVLGAVLFVSAGTLAVPMFWLYLAVLTILSLLAVVLVYRRSPDLIKERLHPGEGDRDKAFMGAALPLFVLHLAIAGVDVGRTHWSSSVPLALQVAALVGYAAGMWLIEWAMLVNRFFSSAVRLQADRGQQVITSGPYRFVRHPGYAGGILFLVCSGLALGSWLSVAPMLVSLPLVVSRTMVEDRMLQHELAGYPDYVQKVRYRLIPGLW